MRTNLLKWETNVKNGVCGIEFDRRDIPLNKLVVSTLESKFMVYELKALHPESGYAFVSEMAHKSTIWGARHLPQNRDLFATMGGNGTLNIYKYNYPISRTIKDDNNLEKGVAGTVTLINSRNISTQPICGFDWCKEKTGLACMACLDQTCKVVVVTKLDLY
jgi:hypothetical protein